MRQIRSFLAAAKSCNRVQCQVRGHACEPQVIDQILLRGKSILTEQKKTCKFERYLKEHLAKRRKEFPAGSVKVTSDA